MNVQQQVTQRTLFAPQLPSWPALPREAQQAILEALAQMLVQAVEPDRNTQTNFEQETSS